MKRATYSLLTILIAIPISTNFIEKGHAIERRPSAVFYLDARMGCYSLSYSSSLRVPFDEVKKLYRVSCSELHHFEVFSSGELEVVGKSSSQGSNSNAGKFALDHCVKEFRKLKFNKRYKSDYNWSSQEEISMGNWIADTGPELVRYSNKFVCYLGQGVKNRPFFKEVAKPLIKGFEKYEN
jgi:hypothetical protein